MKLKNEWLVVLNPHAGGKQTVKLWPSIKTELESNDFNFDLQQTEAPLHSIKIVQKGIAEGYRKIIAIGGDGTLHEIINGVMNQTAVAPSEILLGVISIGTGNDWIKTHQISDDYKVAIQQIKSGKTILQDVGKISFKNDELKHESRYFINSVGIGFDAKVVKYMLQKKQKGKANKKGYMLGLIRSLFTNKNVKGLLHIDEKSLDAKIYNLSIGLCKFKGGGFKLLPNAVPNDGKLEITLASSISKLKLLKSLPKIFGGKVEKIKYFSFYQAQRILFEIMHPLCTEVDGEFLSYYPYGNLNYPTTNTINFRISIEN